MDALASPRQWPISQSWHDLLFAYWPVPAALVTRHVPAPFAVETFDGAAFISVIASRITRARLNGVRIPPFMADYLEVNFGTVVRMHDRPGVYFFSVDVTSDLAVLTARTMFNLPYHAATTQLRRAERLDYESRRRDGRASYRAVAEPGGAPGTAPAGSLEHFLTERYAMYYVGHRRQPRRVDIIHAPWQLQTASGVVMDNTLGESIGIHQLPGRPLLLFARDQEVRVSRPIAV